MRMIDRMAKAMFENEYMGRSWDNDYDCYAKDSWRKAAVRVLLAMLEPTESMVVAGVRHENMGDMAGRWKAMIEAALVEMPDQN